MYDIQGELDGRLIVVRCAGFWDDAELAAYCSALLRSGRAAGGAFDMLIDMRNFPAQKAAGGPEIETMVGHLVRMGMRHVAILAPSAVQRMQVNRITAGNHVFFEEEAEARAWLRRMRIVNRA